MQMTQTSGASSPMDNTLIPTGALCWAMVAFRGMKIGQEKGSRYADVELTVADQQPFARRKVWTKVADPDYEGNSDKYREMGMVALTRMVEACNIVDPSNGASYEKLNGLKIEQVMAMLDGKYVAIKVKIEKQSGGYQDKNDVATYLTPNPQSDGNKGYLKLMAGDYGVQTNPAASRGGQGGFGNAPRAAAPAPSNNSGFGQRQQGGSARPFDQQTQTMKSPSDQQGGSGFNPNRAPSFLKPQ